MNDKLDHFVLEYDDASGNALLAMTVGDGSRVADGQPAYFPIVVMGRYEKCGGKVNMPVNITIAHAVADGYHAGLFFRYLQEELDFLR